MKSAILCAIQEANYAIDAHSIESIEPIGKITPILAMPDYLPGVMPSKHGLLTMIDAAPLLTGTPTKLDASAKAVVFTTAGKKYGLQVTSAYDFIALKEDQWGETEGRLPFLTPVKHEKEHSLHWLDLQALVQYMASLG